METTNENKTNDSKNNERRTSFSRSLSKDANGALQRLYKLSWVMIGLSLLMDTSHVRSFPSYNIILGVWAYSASFYGGNKKDKKTIELQQSSMLSLLKSLSAFSFVVIVSLILDVFFCIIWGEEVCIYFWNDNRTIVV